MSSPAFRTLNACFLSLTTAMYLGTGWSLWLFQFPAASSLTPDNYYEAFVPQVHAATRFFTGMTILMLLSGLLMIRNEWKTGYRWVPIVVVLAVLAATQLTRQFIFPYNEVMSAGIKDPAVLHETLGKWIALNKVRVSLWTVQWLAMMIYFALRAHRAERGATGGAKP